MTVAMLTDRQEKFALKVAEGSTKADAYRAFYKTDGWNIQAVAEAGGKLSLKPKVAARIMELTKSKRDKAEGEFDMTVKKLLLTFIQIAFTDPNELISVRQGACRHCWGVGGGYQWKEREYLQRVAEWAAAHALWEHKRKGDEPVMPDASGGFGYRFSAHPNPECHECEGEGVSRLVPKDTTKLSEGARLLYRGAQQTKDGLKILFADKDQALDKIGRILGAYDDRLRVDLRAGVVALQMTTSDPAEAAKAYESMLTASS